MNKTIVYSIVGVVAVVLGVSMLTHSTINTEGVQTQNGASEAASVFAAGRYTLKDILDSRTSQECSFSDASGMNGTVYIADGKMRGDFTSMVNGVAVATHMISMQDTNYIWTDSQNQGIMIPVSSTAASQGETSSVNMDQSFDYTCKPWVNEGDKFIIPSSIVFADVTKLLPRDAASGMPTGR